MAAATVDEYLAGLPDPARAHLAGIRAAVHAAVPGAGETISYAMPTFTLDGRAFVHVSAWKEHAGLYPLPELPADRVR
jgi:uncharacterized protein YdhG (YjbR/CyaY superfamily)